MNRMQTRNSYRTAPTPLVSLSQPASPRKRGNRLAGSATTRLPKQRQTNPVRRAGRAAQAQEDREKEQQQEEDDFNEPTEADNEQEEQEDDSLFAAEEEAAAKEAEQERHMLHQPPLPSSASLLWSVLSYLFPVFKLVLKVSVVAFVFFVVAVSLSAAFLPWQSVLASAHEVLSSLTSLLSVLLSLSSSSPSSPAAVTSHVQQHLPTVIRDLSSAHPRFSSALHSSFLPALQHHFALQQPSRPLVFFVAESLAVSEQEGETRAVITELAHALYPAAVPGMLLDLSTQLKQPRFTGRQLSAALQAFFSRREDGLLLLPSLLSLPPHQLADIVSTLQLLCDDSLAPHRRAVFVITAELEEQKQSPQHVRAAVRQRLLEAAVDAELVDAILSRLLRNIVVVRE
jgi:hypothetical protein